MRETSKYTVVDCIEAQCQAVAQAVFGTNVQKRRGFIGTYMQKRRGFIDTVVVLVGS